MRKITSELMKVGLGLGFFVTFSSQAQTWDLAGDMASIGSNNSPWVLGYYDSNGFNDFLYHDPLNWYRDQGQPSWLDIWLNTGSYGIYGISPNHVSLHADYGTPVARFVAPYTGTYSIDTEIGGTTSYMGVIPINYGTGNHNAYLAGLSIDGILETYTSFDNNKKIWTLNNIQLTKGQVIDAYVGGHEGGGNTDTLFTVTSNSNPISAPNVIWLFGAGMAGFSRFSRRNDLRS